VRIPLEAELTEPVHVNVASLGARGFSHVIVDAGRHSKAIVIIDHTGAGELASNVEIVVGDGAELRVVSIQQGDHESIHLGQHDALVGRDAKLHHVVVTLAARSSGSAPTSGTPGLAATRSCSGCTRRVGSAPREPAVRRPRGRAVQEQT